MDNEPFTISDTQRPLYNPFENGRAENQVIFGSGSLKVDGRPSLTLSGDGEFAMRDESDESLGILTNAMLSNDSLTNDFLPTTFGNVQIGSPRESLGILNLSFMDLGRESIGIFDINKPFFKREFSDSDRTVLEQNLIPRIVCHDMEDKANSTSLVDLNTAFLFPNSRKISSGSSADPSFNSRSLEEFSKISSISSIQKDLEPSSVSYNPFNQAFQICQGTKSYSASYKSSSTHYFGLDLDLEIMRKRIQSLPSALEDNNGNLCGAAFGNRSENVIVGLLCRGLEDEKDLDGSVFTHDERQEKNEDGGDKSFDAKPYFLDCISPPNWGDGYSSKSNADYKEQSTTVISLAGISNEVDKMLDMRPVNLEERLKVKNLSKCDRASFINTSQNISKVSRASQCSLTENMSCASNNLSQDLSKISRSSEENISWLIKNLSYIINEKENLSKSQRDEGHRMLTSLASILNVSANEGTNLDDKNDKIEAADGSNGKICEALDLSYKRKSISHLKSPSVRNPLSCVPYSPNTGVATENHTKSNNASQSSNASAKSAVSFRRHSNISQNKISFGAEKLKRPKSGIVSKKEPLRAVLPVENMAKDTKSISSKSAHFAVTPERNEGANRVTLKSKRTSTPLQEPKIKPVAASTPASRQSKDKAISPAARPKLVRSFSNQTRLSSSTTEQPSSGRKSGQISGQKVMAKKPISKGDAAKTVRRNSITESTLNRESVSEDLGPQKLKRSFSTGRESKIFSVLSRVRENILNSPYYRKSTDGSDDDSKRAKPSNRVSSQTRKVEKEQRNLSFPLVK